MICLTALIIRLNRTSWGLPYLHHWDEPQVASVALNMMRTGDFNPHIFIYGSFYIYLNFVVDTLHYYYLMGKPETAESFLRNIGEIRTNRDTGWDWIISHPSFYQWNRALTALFGVGTVLLVFFLGKALRNSTTGLVASSFLAVLPIHVQHSAFVTTDIPVAFFVVGVILFAVLFVQRTRKIYLILSLVSCGLATATKYNGAFSILMPILCLGWMQLKKKSKPAYWLYILFIPAITFFLAMPYAALDLPTFLYYSGFQLRHYKLEGHFEATIAPGWPHIRFQLHLFYQELGLMAVILLGIGLAASFRRLLFLFTSALLLGYFISMGQMSINFHRNYILLYPLISLLIGLGISVIHQTLLGMSRKTSKALNIFYGVAPAIFLILFCPMFYHSVKESLAIKTSLETRTQAVLAANNIAEKGGFSNVLIAEELRVHEQDLRKFRLPYSVKPIEYIMGHPVIIPGQKTLCMLPENLSALKKSPDIKGKIFEFDRFRSRLQAEQIIRAVGPQGSVTNLDIISTNPCVLIVQKLAAFPFQVPETDIPLYLFEMSNQSKISDHGIEMLSNGDLISPIFSFAPKSYILSVRAKGSASDFFKEKTKMGISIVLRRPDDKEVQILGCTLDLADDFSDYEFPFEISENEKGFLKISFINDLYDPHAGKDRNLYVHSEVLRSK